MHEDYGYEEEDHDDDEYDHDHPSLNPYNYYFKFDVGSDTPLSKWLGDMFKDINWEMISSFQPINIPGFPFVSFPVNSYFPNTVNENSSLLYLGNNYYKEGVWKTKFFIKNEIQQQYVLHLQSHAGHFLRQPKYYKGLYDILN